MDWFRRLISSIENREEWIMTTGVRTVAMFMIVLALFFAVRIMFQLGLL